MEQTYIMIKPDGVQRGLVAEIIKRFEQKGFHLRGLKMQNVTKEHAEKHYKDLSSKCAPAVVKCCAHTTLIQNAVAVHHTGHLVSAADQ
jgi:nucleoside diphosphate kinase